MAVASCVSDVVVFGSTVSDSGREEQDEAGQHHH
jgi:hypothetical protein